MDKIDKMDRRSFIKTLGLGAGLILAPNLPGILMAQEKGDRIPSFTITTVNRSDMVELGRTMSNELKGIGIETNVETLEVGAFLTKTSSKHETDMAAMTFGGTPERLDPSFFITEFYHSKYAGKGGRNYEHYRNPEYDKVCDESNIEMEREKRMALVWKCQEILARDYPIWVVGFPVILHAYNSQDWEDPVPMMGAGIGGNYNYWTWLRIRPKTSRRKVVACDSQDLSSLSLGTKVTHDRVYLRLIYDPFVKIDPKLNVVPWAASSWKIVDKKTIDIVLRGGMKFHDGKPVTIEDAKFSFDYFKNKNMASYTGVTERIEKTEILPNNTLRIYLTNPYGPFMQRVLTDAHIIPKHIWEKIDEPDKFPNEKPVGSGPFKFGYWKRGEEIYFEANKDHFDPPNIDGAFRKVIPSLEAMIAALETKEVDLHHERLSDNQAKAFEKFKHISIMSSHDHGVYEVRSDLDKKPFSDLPFRRAVSHIIPRKQYMDQVFGKAAIAAANSILHPELKPWYNEKVQFDEYSPQKAKEILKAAGYWWDNNGLLHYPK